MKKKCYAYVDRHRKLMKLILMMKATFILSVLFALQVHAGVYSQQVRMSMEFESASIKQIINEIKLHTEFSFVYSDADLEGIVNKDVMFKDATIEDILNSCLKGTGLKYSIEEKTIVIWKKNCSACRNKWRSELLRVLCLINRELHCRERRSC